MYRRAYTAVAILLAAIPAQASVGDVQMRVSSRRAYAQYDAIRRQQELHNVIYSKMAQRGSTTYRDAAGRNVGSATTQGSSTTFRDAGGRNVGTATTRGNTTTFRDAGGRSRQRPHKESMMTWLPYFFLAGGAWWIVRAIQQHLREMRELQREQTDAIEGAIAERDEDCCDHDEPAYYDRGGYDGGGYDGGGND